VVDLEKIKEFIKYEKSIADKEMGATGSYEWQTKLVELGKLGDEIYNFGKFRAMEDILDLIDELEILNVDDIAHIVEQQRKKDAQFIAEDLPKLLKLYKTPEKIAQKLISRIKFITHNSDENFKEDKNNK